MIANIQALCKCPCGIEFYERRPLSDFSLALSLSEGVNSINSRGVRMKRLKLLICSGTLFLAGCADVANYQANLQTSVMMARSWRVDIGDQGYSPYFVRRHVLWLTV